jgi:hypothetical protein
MVQTQTKAAKLEEIYTLRGEEDVYEFLTPELTDVLLELPEKLQPYFPSAPLSLKVNRDYDDSSWVKLEARIFTDLDVDTAFDKFDAFLDAWWLKTPAKVRTSILVALEYPDDEL